MRWSRSQRSGVAPVVGGEVAGEAARGHAGVRGEVGDGERFVQVAQGVFAYGGQGVGVAVRGGWGAR